MSTLIIKSKIWNIPSYQSINYKDKNFRKQKLTIETSSSIYRQKDKIFSKKIDESNLTSNSNDNTNYMNEKKDELITISKQPDDKYVVNCGNWSKDLTKLIDENAAYILYKGLTIENLLKEKQKYYVLNQGDIIKLGKIHLKLLHINLYNSDNENEEEKKEENKSIKEEEKEDEKENNEENNEEDDINENEEDEKDDNIKIDDENKENLKNKILMTYTKYDIDKTNKNKEVNNKNRVNYNIGKNNNFTNYSFSYIPKNYQNISLYMKYHKNENKKDRLNKSFDGKIPLLTVNNIMKESINFFHSKSPKISQIKFNSFLQQFESKNNQQINIETKSKEKVKDKPKRKINAKLTKKNKSKKTEIKTLENNKQKTISVSINNSESLPPQILGKICRICLSGEDNPIENPLVCPCECKGSMKYIHYLCLKNWLNLKVESELGHRRNLLLEQPTITYSTSDISCELCKAKLPDYIRHDGKIFNVLFYKPKYDKFLVLESIRDDNRRTKFIHIIPLVKKNMIKIGRLNTCDLSLPDISISRVHCCVYVEGGQLFLENNSKYGTKILVQNTSLVMSSSFPLCIEIQNTYLKLELKKNFSFIGCCGINTTTISKMLVYQEQNEKGFDIFCSMIIKEDNDNNDKEVENEEQKEQNGEINNSINNQDVVKKDNSQINLTNEEIKKNENIEKTDNEDINSSKRKNRNKKREIIEESLDDKNKIKVNEIINEIKLEKSRNENDKEKEINNLNNSLKSNSKEEISNQNNEPENIIKSIKIIKEVKSKEKGDFTYRTMENDVYHNYMNASDIKSKSNIYNELNWTTQRNNKNLSDKILTNLKREKYKSNQINNLIKKELQKEKENLINANYDKKNENGENSNNEIQRIVIKKDEENKKNELIQIKNNSIEENNERKEPEKKELNNNNNLIINKDNIIDNKNEKEKAIFKKKEEKIKNEELKNRNLNAIKEETTEKISSVQYNEEIEDQQKSNLSQKKLINKKFQEIMNNNNNSINNNETKFDKTIIDQKDETETTKNIINLDKKDSVQIKSNHDNSDTNINHISEGNKINKESKKQKKLLNNTIDLNEINELSYGKMENSCNLNYSPIDSYQSIFGLRQKNKNEGSALLAPKHKNINFQKLELKSNKDKNIILNKYNQSKNKYTYQYEEDKKSKNNNN